MLSVIVPTHESEGILVPTLACLVPGATDGLIRDVILADAGSTDETAAVGDVAGCRFLSMPGPLGPRLAHAANAARGDWLMFVPAGAVLDPGWIADVRQFIERARDPIAAVFAAAGRPRVQESRAHESMLRAMIAVWRARRTGLSPGRGLLIGKTFYRDLGGHSDRDDTEPELLRRIGRRRLMTLRTGILSHGEH